VRFTRAELLAAAGARPEELTALEQQGLVGPRRPWWRFGRRPAWYSDAHLDVNQPVFGAGGGLGEHAHHEADVWLVGVAGHGAGEAEGVPPAVGAGTALLILTGDRRAMRGAGAGFAYRARRRRGRGGRRGERAGASG
jgi:hypothetical protein